MRLDVRRQPARGLRVICLWTLLTGTLVSVVPAMALEPPKPCEPGEFQVRTPISFTLIGPDAPIDAQQQVVFRADTPEDLDYCPTNETIVTDTVTSSCGISTGRCMLRATTLLRSP